jgi:hypothetical protein
MVLRHADAKQTGPDDAAGERVELGLIVAETEGLGLEDWRVGVDYQDSRHLPEILLTSPFISGIRHAF